jgi:ABC-type sugar transport system ATPase subunit
MEQPILTVRGLCKSFPGVRALDHVDFDLMAGEVHVLVGENGAGKSTLAKCVLGLYQHEEGEIRLNGELVAFKSPKEGLEHGVVAVYQELTMVPYLNAAQNIFLNREPLIKGTPFIDHRKMQKEAKVLLTSLGCAGIDTKIPVKLLDVAQQQMIEIAKALSYRPKIIVLDEPTAPLSEREIEPFFEQVKKLRDQGIGIIYVSHRMQEYHRIGDRITVLRDGKFIRTLKVGELTDEELVNLMVGRDIAQVYVRTKNDFNGEALRTEALCDKKGRVKSCSITLNKGEIVGVAGLVGSGRTEMARLIFGIDKPASGKVYLHGKDITGRSPSYVVANGLGLLPEDRKRFGLAVKASIAWNTVAVSLKKIFPHGIVSEKKTRKIAEDYVKLLKTSTPDVVRPVSQLSGGNQQKVVVAKWLSAESDVVIFDEPTRGIDVGAKMEIYALMDKLASEGKAILMISSEMQEVIGMSDRLYIMKDGCMISEVKHGECTQEEIGRIMVLGKEALV